MKEKFAMLFIGFVLVVSIFASGFALADDSGVSYDEYGSSGGGHGNGVPSKSQSGGGAGGVIAPIPEYGSDHGGEQIPITGDVIDETEVSVDLSDLPVDADEKSQIQETIREFENEKSTMRIGFAKIWRGQGWIDNGQEGYLMHGFWINQAFTKKAESDALTASAEDFKVEKAFGRMWIGQTPYHLIKAEDEDQTIFYLHKNSANKDNPEEDALGTLVLIQEESLENMIIWKGSLEFDRDTWDVELATHVNSLKKTSEEVEDSSIFTRIFGGDDKGEEIAEDSALIPQPEKPNFKSKSSIWERIFGGNKKIDCIPNENGDGCRN